MYSDDLVAVSIYFLSLYIKYYIKLSNIAQSSSNRYTILVERLLGKTYLDRCLVYLVILITRRSNLSNL